MAPGTHSNLETSTLRPDSDPHVLPKTLASTMPKDTEGLRPVTPPSAYHRATEARTPIHTHTQILAAEINTKQYMRASNTAQWGLAAKPDDLSSMPGAHMVD